MLELARTNDPVALNAMQTLLESAGFSVLIADEHVSAIEGTIGAFQRRLLVFGDDAADARALLIEAGFGGELRAHE